MDAWFTEAPYTLSRQRAHLIEPGTLSVCPARFRHQLVLRRDPSSAPVRAMSLFATGVRVGSWGFEGADGRIAEIGTAEARRRATAGTGPAGVRE